MEPLVRWKGIVAPLDTSNVDTDQIIPKQFLKRIERTGYGEFLFYDWRYKEDGTPNPDFLLNRKPYTDATILLSRDNFGCGSSREHAPWALADFGFRVIVASGFADIFYNNCFKNGILPLRLDRKTIDALFREAEELVPCQWEVQLDNQVLVRADGTEIPFDVDEFRKSNLLQGKDDIALTLEHESAISRFEQEHKVYISVPK